LLDGLDRQQAVLYEAVEKDGAVVNAGPLRRADDGPVGEKPRLVARVVQVSEVKRFEESGLPIPGSARAADHFEDEPLRINSGHDPSSPGRWPGTRRGL